MIAQARFAGDRAGTCFALLASATNLWRNRHQIASLRCRIFTIERFGALDTASLNSRTRIAHGYTQVSEAHAGSAPTICAAIMSRYGTTLRTGGMASEYPSGRICDESRGKREDGKTPAYALVCRGCPPPPGSLRRPRQSDNRLEMLFREWLPKFRRQPPPPLLIGCRPQL